MLSQGQMILLYFTILSTIYQLSQVLQLAALVNKWGKVEIKWEAYLMLLFTIGIQTVFILTLTGNIVI